MSQEIKRIVISELGIDEKTYEENEMEIKKSLVYIKASMRVNYSKLLKEIKNKSRWRKP